MCFSYAVKSAYNLALLIQNISIIKSDFLKTNLVSNLDIFKLKWLKKVLEFDCEGPKPGHKCRYLMDVVLNCFVSKLKKKPQTKTVFELPNFKIEDTFWTLQCDF